MSNSFNDQLSRMKALMTYGAVNEDAKPISTYNIEYKAKAADGKYYGIIRENSKYYVKVATPGKEMIAEDYQYIGGIMNKPNYEYTSYNNALKQFELKLGSINEAYDENRKVNVEALDPFKKEDLVIEGTEKMKNELARQRQIMRNASVIMNEQTEIGSTPFKTQPEAPKGGSEDKDYPFTKEGKAEEDRGAIKFGEGAPEKHSATFGEDAKDVEDYDLDKGKSPKVAGSVASESPKGGKAVRVNESMGECGIYEDDDEDFDFESDDDEEFGNGDGDGEFADSEEPTDDELSADGEDGEEVLDDGEEYEGEEDDFDDEDEFDEEPEEDGFEDDEDLDAGDEEDLDAGDEDEFEDEEDLEAEDELGDEEGLDGGEEFEGDDELGDEEEDPEIELDENVVKKFRQLVRESINEMMGEWNGSDELEMMEKYPEDWSDEDDGYTEDDVERVRNRLIDAAEYGYPMNEAKAAKMNRIVESVVNDILNEDELHVFGDHPGYRKKPMTLPQTGSDNFQGNRDWNDDSVHSEEPFGQGKGDSTPFDLLVAQITDSVMKQINEGKKKVK